MKKLKMLLTILTIFVTLYSNNLEKFEILLAEGEFDSAKSALDEWAKSNSEDSRYYFSYFNYYLTRSEQSTMGFTTEEPNTDDALVLTAPDTGETVGYMGTTVHYDPALIQEAIDIIKEGIIKFPDNFNMRFGLLYADLLANKWESYIIDFENTLMYFSTADKNEIYWFYEQKLENPEEYLIEHIQVNFYDITHDETIPRNDTFLNEFCDLLVKYFPNHKYGYTNKGVIANHNGDNEKAIEHLLKAHSKDENDILIAFNIGFIYKQMSKFDEAKKFFNKVIEIGNDAYYVEGAKALLEEME